MLLYRSMCFYGSHVSQPIVVMFPQQAASSTCYRLPLQDMLIRQPVMGSGVNVATVLLDAPRLTTVFLTRDRHTAGCMTMTARSRMQLAMQYMQQDTHLRAGFCTAYTNFTSQPQAQKKVDCSKGVR